MRFDPETSLIEGLAHSRCRAIVALPARNEEASLAATLNALAAQRYRFGRQLAQESFEVVLLLNNCTDQSAAVAQAWKQAHPNLILHCCEKELPREKAHIGTVRKLLMDTAWARLSSASEPCIILATDSDSYAAPDWIDRNLRAIERGEDPVGRDISIINDDYEALPNALRLAYAQDRRYQVLVAEMEDLFDPQQGDAWPRHLEHFGASLGCTPEIYARAGGIPAVAELEDVAFVDRLRRVDARLRHEPGVVVYTSARLDGRTATGLAGQLRCWQQMHDRGQDHMVLSAAYLRHRFHTLRRLRNFYATGGLTHLLGWSSLWRQMATEARKRASGVGEFLMHVDCDRLIDQTFHGTREGVVAAVNATLAKKIARERAKQIALIAKPLAVERSQQNKAAKTAATLSELKPAPETSLSSLPLPDRTAAR